MMKKTAAEESFGLCSFVRSARGQQEEDTLKIALGAGTTQLGGSSASTTAPALATANLVPTIASSAARQDQGVQAGPPRSDAPGPGKLVMLADITEKGKRCLNGRHGIIRSCNLAKGRIEVELRVDGQDKLVTVPRSCATVYSRSCADLDPAEAMNILLRSPMELRKQVLFDLQGSLKGDVVVAKSEGKRVREEESKQLRDELATMRSKCAKLEEDVEDANARLTEASAIRRQLVEELQFLQSENARLEFCQITERHDAGKELARQWEEVNDERAALEQDSEALRDLQLWLQREQADLKTAKQELSAAQEVLRRQTTALDEERDAHEEMVARDALWLEKERENVRLLAADATSRTVARNRNELLGWEWRGDDGWYAFSESATKTLNQALYNGQEHVEVLIGGQRYDCDLRRLRQTNLSSKRMRDIQLSGLPLHWFSTEAIVDARLRMTTDPAWSLVERQLPGSPHALHSGFQLNWGPRGLQYLRHRPDLREKFTELLRTTCYHHIAFAGPSRCSCMEFAQVVSVQQVHNVELLQRYQEFVDELARKHQRHPCPPEAMYPEVEDRLRVLEEEFSLDPAPSTRCRERFLWHGTTKMQDIVREGFDGRLAQDGLFGRGTYFASQNCKAHAYCSQYGQKTMILTRVALGDIQTVQFADRTACRPQENPMTGERFDSMMAPPGPMLGGVNAGFQFHQEFIIFDNRQALPEFVVEIAF